MPSSITLSMTAQQHAELRTRLLDEAHGNEALAFLICGHRNGDWKRRYVVNRVMFPDPKAIIEATPDRLHWQTDCLADVMDIAEARGHVIIKIHSHPTGYSTFSSDDDQSDMALLPMLQDSVPDVPPHGSAILLPDGTIRARLLSPTGAFVPVDLVTVVGDDICVMPAPDSSGVPDFVTSHATLFGSATYSMLKPLTAGIVGVSGTGSPLAEQLVRLGIGRLVLVDDDDAEARNLNRVYNMTRADVDAKIKKVTLAERELGRIGTGTEIVAIPRHLSDPASIRAIASCDVIFGCVDSLEGRFLLSLISAYYGQPYIDLGVKLDTYQNGTIREVCGTVHYLRPGGGSLMTRGLFTIQQASDEAKFRRSPHIAKQLEKAGYINGITERRPAVISVNTSLAAQAVNEMLARLSPFRDEANEHYASVTVSFTSMEFTPVLDTTPCPLLSKFAGLGDTWPLLGLPELGVKVAA